MKKWLNPELKRLGLDNTNNEDVCPNNEARCFCEYYHVRLFGGCGGCKAPDYKCKYTGCKPIIKKCTCDSNKDNDNSTENPSA